MRSRPSLRRLAARLFVAGAVLAIPLAAGAQAGDRGISLAGVGHDKGNSVARVSIVEFGDFGCLYCAKFAKETEPALDSLYVRTGRVRWKYVPFVTGNFPNAREAAEAAECAGEQDAFWKMYELLYARRTEWMKSREPRRVLARYATELKLDGSRFALCSLSKPVRERVLRNDAIASSLSLRGTPTFFINGQMVPGALPLDIFKQVIESVLR